MTRFAFDLAAWFSDNADQVCRDLESYFGGGAEPSTGRWFEAFAAIGDPNRFEPSDVLTVEAMSVKVPPEAAATLLIAETERFNALLRQIPREQNLWDVRRLDVNVGSPADDLHHALIDVDDIGWVVAGKLLAAKRPKLLPVLDNDVNDFLKPPRELFWVTLHDELSDPVRRGAITEVCLTAPRTSACCAASMSPCGVRPKGGVIGLPAEIWVGKLWPTSVLVTP